MGRCLASHSCKKRELKAQSEVQSGGVNQYYGIGAVIAVGVIGGLGYYIYGTKKRAATTEWGEASREVNMTPNPTVSQQLSPKVNKFEMD